MKVLAFRKLKGLAGGVKTDLTCYRLLEMLDGRSLVTLPHSPSADSASVTVPTWQVRKPVHSWAEIVVTVRTIKWQGQAFSEPSDQLLCVPRAVARNPLNTVTL